MGGALGEWREKLDFLQKEEATAIDADQKFALTNKIKEAKAKIIELEASAKTWKARRKHAPLFAAAILLVAGLLIVAGIYIYRAWNAPKFLTFAASAGFSIFAKPEQDAAIISRVSAGEEFGLLKDKKSTNWVFVRHGEKEGWALAQDMSVVTPIEIAQGLGFRGSYWQLFFTSPQPKDGQTNEFGIDARFAQAITQCKSSLDIAVYEFNDKLIAKAILDAHTRSVEVRIVTDEASLNWPPTRAVFDELKQSGIAVIAKKNGGRLMHNKFAILDNASVWTGSWNYTETGTFKNNENVIAIDSPEVAAAFTRKFQKLFNDGYDRVAHSSEAAQSPPLPHGVHVFFAPEDSTLQVLSTAFSEAKKSIRFMTMAFTSDDVTEVLQRQAAKGVSVRGITEKRLMHLPAAKSLLTASAPNLEVRVDGNPRFLRHNCAIVDDRIVWFGSMNITKTGNRKNDETLISIPDAALASKFNEEFERLWAVAQKPQFKMETESNKEEDPDETK
jgi:phosphatidylserine/phosphatidylglycerophosphate/cardiolipin synthase-like enzyme